MSSQHPDQQRLADLATELNSVAIHLVRRLRREDEALGVSAARLSALSVLVFGGPRTLGHMKDYLAAMSHGWIAEDEALVDRLVASGHPSTPGYNDPGYPIEGRPIRA